jgi:hypothetical protein
MNTYDPADYIVYVTMDRGRTAGPAADGGVETPHRLPRGYADQSPRTRLRSRVPTRPTGAGADRYRTAPSDRWGRTVEA